MNKFRCKNKKAFTIIELIVVIAVIGILVLLAAPRFLGYVNKTQIVRIQNDVKVMEDKVQETLAINKDAFTGEEISREQLIVLINEDRVFDLKGIVDIDKTDEIEIGVYKVISSQLVSDINTKLPGKFYAGSDGTVYYEHNKSLGDRIIPAKITVEPYITDPTNQDITVKVNVDKGKLNSKEHTFTENDSFTFIATYKDVETTETITITNIDKAVPIITFEYDDNPIDGPVTVVVKTSKGELVEDTFTFEYNGTKEFTAVDDAGNITTATITIDNILSFDDIIEEGTKNEDFLDKTIILDDLDRIHKVFYEDEEVNSFSEGEDSIQLNIVGLTPYKEEENPIKDSKIVEGFTDNSSNNFDKTKDYSDDDGYTGELTKKGESYVESGTYTPSDTKNVDGQTNANYNQNGYTGTLSQYVYSGTLIEADTKNVSSKIGPQLNTSFPVNQAYNGAGYTGTLNKSGSYFEEGSTIDTKTVSDSATSSSNSFSNTKAYNSDGYVGTLSKNGASSVISGNYTAPASRTETDSRISYGSNSNPSTISYNSGGYSGTLNKGNTTSNTVQTGGNAGDSIYVTAQTNASYNSGGYTGNLSSYVYSGIYTPADNRYVTSSIGPQESTSFPASKSYNIGGYSGTLSKSGSYTDSTQYGQFNRDYLSCHSGNRYGAPDNIQAPNGSTAWQISCVAVPNTNFDVVATYRYVAGDGRRKYSQNYGGTAYRSASDTRVYRYQGTVTKPDTRTYRTDYTSNYSGTVTKPEVDTRNWQQNYSGNATKTIPMYSQNYSGSVTKPAVDTRVHRYKGSVTKPAVDTRQWKQDYSGTVYKSGLDKYYKHNIRIEYFKKPILMN